MLPNARGFAAPPHLASHFHGVFRSMVQAWNDPSVTDWRFGTNTRI